jgi:hypothetical protein
MTNDTPNFDNLSPVDDDRAAKYLSNRYCLPLTLAAIIAVSAGIGEYAN